MKEFTKRDFLKITGNFAQFLPALVLPSCFKSSPEAELPIRVDWLPVYDRVVDESFRRATNPFQRWECLFETEDQHIYYGLSICATAANSVAEPGVLLFVCNQPYSELYKMLAVLGPGGPMKDSLGKLTATTLDSRIVEDALNHFNRVYSVDFFLYQLAVVPSKMFSGGTVPRYIKNCDFPKEADCLMITAPPALDGLDHLPSRLTAYDSGSPIIPLRFLNAIRGMERSGCYGYYTGVERRLINQA